MGCVFCASGLNGVERNLTSGEILEQMLRLQRLLPAEERLSHIVMMGMGEPLANLDNVTKTLAIASDEQGLGISARRITISTGAPSACPGVRKAPKGVSVNAPRDTARKTLISLKNAAAALSTGAL